MLQLQCQLTLKNINSVVSLFILVIPVVMIQNEGTLKCYVV